MCLLYLTQTGEDFHFDLHICFFAQSAVSTTKYIYIYIFEYMLSIPIAFVFSLLGISYSASKFNTRILL